jgi:hypothetical protein
MDCSLGAGKLHFINLNIGSYIEVDASFVTDIAWNFNSPVLDV